VPTDRKDRTTQRHTTPNTEVPWTGFDLINAFNAWKKTDTGSTPTQPEKGGAEHSPELFDTL
jgi:putative transposase